MQVWLVSEKQLGSEKPNGGNIVEEKIADSGEEFSLLGAVEGEADFGEEAVDFEVGILGEIESWKGGLGGMPEWIKVEIATDGFSINQEVVIASGESANKLVAGTDVDLDIDA